MLKDRVIIALNEHVKDTLQKLPRMKEAYLEQFEEMKKMGLGDAFSLRSTIVHEIYHNLRHESMMIFARNSDSRFPTEAEIQEMGKLLDRHTSEIESKVNSLDWF